MKKPIGATTLHDPEDRRRQEIKNLRIRLNHICHAVEQIDIRLTDLEEPRPDPDGRHKPIRLEEVRYWLKKAVEPDGT